MYAGLDVTLSLSSSVRLEQHHSKHKWAATVMALGATITSSLYIALGASCYEEAMWYLLVTMSVSSNLIQVVV